MTGERRIGKRAEQKRKHDWKPCPNCGRRMARESQQCVHCVSERYRARDRRIIELRHDGHTNVEIARLLGTTPAVICTVFYQLKRAGVDVGRSPYNQPQEAQ